MGIAAAFMVPHPPLIVPDVGKGEEKKIMDTVHAYHEIGKRIGELEPETIVVISPHQTMYADYFHISPGKGAKGDLGQFRAGNVKMEVSYDTEFVRELCRLADIGRIPAGTLGEREKRLDHGTMVPLYFVEQYWKEYHLVRIGLSGLPLITHYELGQCIQKVSENLGRKTVLIGSGDLSHRLKEDGPYGYREEGPAYDSRIMDIMAKGGFGELLEFPEDFCEKAGECGHRSFTIMAGALDRLELEAERLSYEGPFGVGYGICSYIPCGWNQERDFGEKYEQKEKERLSELRGKEDAYVRLARKTIEEYVRNKKKINMPEGLPGEMSGRAAGVFVSLKKDGRLRGCIGAISASVRDSRFEPVEPEELDRLVISVDVLGDTEKIDSHAQLDVKRYGVIVTKGYRRGLLLPNLDGVDTVEEQIAIAKRKAGIGESEQVELERFEVVRHF